LHVAQAAEQTADSGLEVPDDSKLNHGKLQSTATSTSSSPPNSLAELYSHREQVEEKLRELTEATESEQKEAQLRSVFILKFSRRPFKIKNKKLNLVYTAVLNLVVLECTQL
jgi:hypothetical protein